MTIIGIAIYRFDYAALKNAFYPSFKGSQIIEGRGAHWQVGHSIYLPPCLLLLKSQIKSLTSLLNSFHSSEKAAYYSAVISKSAACDKF